MAWCCMPMRRCRARWQACKKALTALRDHQRINEDPALVAPFAERQRLVRKADWDALEAQYANGRP